MNFNLINIWNDLAVNQYHVDPKIFIFLMLFSTPFYYYGWYGLAREIISFSKKYRSDSNQLRINDIFGEKKFLFPLVINRAAWILPYAYVIGWGENLPGWFWTLLIGWIIISSFLFWRKIKKTVAEKRSGDFVWTLYSSCYDKLNYFRPYQKLIQEMTDELGIQEGEQVIDFGCGTANLERFARDRKGSFVCLDYSSEMLKRAEEKCPECKFFREDLNSISTKKPYGTFDKAVSINLIYNLNNLDDFFGYARKNLKKGGVFVFTTSTRDGLLGIIREQFEGIKLKDLLVFLYFLPPFVLVLLINIYLDKKFRGNFYSTEVLSEAANRNGFEVINRKSSYGDTNIIISARAV